jgi:hypothetical protein
MLGAARNKTFQFPLDQIDIQLSASEVHLWNRKHRSKIDRRM